VSSPNRYEKAQAWLREPERHLHSLIRDEDTVSAVVVGETGEYVVAVGPDGRMMCGCPANRHGSMCSHLLFFAGWLATH